MMKNKKYAIWFKPTNEWLTNRKGEVMTWDSEAEAERYREMIDVVGIPANMEVRECKLPKSK